MENCILYLLYENKISTINVYKDKIYFNNEYTPYQDQNNPAKALLFFIENYQATKTGIYDGITLNEFTRKIYDTDIKALNGNEYSTVESANKLIGQIKKEISKKGIIKFFSTFETATITKPEKLIIKFDKNVKYVSLNNYKDIGEFLKLIKENHKSTYEIYLKLINHLSPDSLENFEEDFGDVYLDYNNQNGEKSIIAYESKNNYDNINIKHESISGTLKKEYLDTLKKNVS